MADKVLSQAEVDALLNGVSSGTVKTEAAQAPMGIRSYDLTSQDRIIRGRMPTLDIINERFSRVFQVTLSSTIRKTVEFSPLSVEVMKFNEFMRKIPVPSSLVILKMDPLRGNILLSLDARLIFILLDYFFGGKGQTYVKAEGRDFTPIEQKFIQKMVDLLIVDLQKAWYPVYPSTISMVRREINPQFAMIVAPTEVTVTVIYKLELEDKVWNIYLCLPYPTIEPIREKLYGGFQSDQLEVDRQWGERFKNQLQGCNVDVTAELGTADIKLRDLLELSAGDIILLDKGVNENLYLKVEDRIKFFGTAGVFNGNTAVKIKKVVQNQEGELNGE
ncbi:MAG: flagellar motor switch protein FliM [Nitrospirae bacterium]|nr:flagellar motor switch protein FliM [Nitrospirota bacterium]MBI3605500.1 flagellar motor switch protein FliM [Nitrospirota bacterium]